MERESVIILNWIGRLQRRSIAFSLFNGGVLLMASALLIVALGIQTSWIFASCLYLRLFYFVSSSLAIIYIAKRCIFDHIYPLLNKDLVALKVEQKYPWLDNSLISSLQLIRSQYPSRLNLFSSKIVSLLIKETANKIVKLNTSSIINKKLIRHNILILIIAVTLFILQLRLSTVGFLDSVCLIFNPFRERRDFASQDSSFLRPPPLIGDIILDYTFPSYTGLKPIRVANSSGDIEAVKGSEVRITAICDQSLDSASLLLDQKLRMPLNIVDNKILKGKLSLLEEGIYRFEMVEQDGPKNTEPHTHKISVLNDSFPQINIVKPAGDLIVSEKDIVRLEYNCSDDYGINDVSLIYSVNGKENRVALQSLTGNQVALNNTYIWEMSATGLFPGAKLAYHLEVRDNDTVSGPKSTSTKTQYLEILSCEQIHKKIIYLQTALLREMSDLLETERLYFSEVARGSISRHELSDSTQGKDHLISFNESINEKSINILSIFDQIIEGMKEDALADYSIYYLLSNMKDVFKQMIEKDSEGIQLTLSHLHEKSYGSSNNPLTDLKNILSGEIVLLEDDIFLLEELLKRQRLDELLAAIQGLRQRQARLVMLLEGLKNNQGDKMSEGILDELKEIEGMVKEIIGRLFSMPQDLPDEFLNSNVFKKIEPSGLYSESQGVTPPPLSPSMSGTGGEVYSLMNDAIQKGDLEGALKSAKDLLDSLDNLMNLFKETSMQYAASIYSGTLDKIDKLLEQLLDLEDEEMGLASKTDELNGRVSGRAYKIMDNMFERFFNEQKERLTAILANISEIDASIQDNQLLNSLTPQLLVGQTHRSAPTYTIPELLNSLTPQLLNSSTPQLLNSSSNLSVFPILLKNISLIKERFSYLSEMLEGWDIEESLMVSKDTLRLLEGLHPKTLELEKAGNANVVANNLSHSVILNEMIVNDLEAFVNSVRGHGQVNLTPEEIALLKGYTEIQSQIKKRASLLQGMIEKIGKESPILGNEIPGNMVKASNLMSYAETKLGQKNLPGAVVDERESLYYLGETRRSLEELKKIITQGLIGAGMPMPFFASGFRSRYNGDGQYGASMEDVNIPSENIYKVPREFREDILEGMKDNFPRRYELLNRDYFKRLLQ